ncbi:MAG: DUF421 domain-containing protein [Tomitella sp.]|nr:DUF421 domain-containing protein [Tomitella sp.]
MFTLEIPTFAKIFRTVCVYAGLAVLLRLAGKRDLAQLNTFDLVVVLLLANVLQNAIIGDDYSLLGGLIGAAVLIAVNAAWVRIAASVSWVAWLTEGSPTELVRDGQIVAPPSRSGLRHADILVALRRQGAHDLDDVARATLTPRGSIVVDLHPSARTATVQDLRDIRGTGANGAPDDVDARLREVNGKLDIVIAELSRREPDAQA